MKKLSMTLGAVGLLCAVTAQAAFDGTVTMTYGSHSSGSGGEFRANIQTGMVGLVTDGITVSGKSGFETFCIERNEHLIANGSLYSASIDNAAILGGVAINGGATPNLPTSKDTLSKGTAWLYAMFRQHAGTLGYNNTSADAGILQNTLWYLENELTLSEFGTTSTKFLDLATAKFGSLAGAQADAAPNAYGVVAVNLYNGNGSIANRVDEYGNLVNQSQLGLVPEPSTYMAAALLLLPFEASTIRILRKNRTA